MLTDYYSLIVSTKLCKCEILYHLLLIAEMVQHNLFSLLLDINNFVNIYVPYFAQPAKTFQRCNSGDEIVKHRAGLASNLGGLLTLATFY